MLKIIETRNTKVDIEERITQDENGFYYKEIRFLPVEDWQPNDGWNKYYVSSVCPKLEKRS